MENRNRRSEIYRANLTAIAEKTDRLFAKLFIFQWILGIVFAFSFSPKTWEGSVSSVHWHVYAAIFLGGLIAAFPIYLGFFRAGQHINRFPITIAQILYSVLFIHLTGGRIETHFHVFGSLAFLSFYRDFRPIFLATLLTAIDHFVRGWFWPESVYGVLTSTPWRALEHSAWVVFEDVVLFLAIQDGIENVKKLAHQQADIEATLSKVESIVEERTLELVESKRIILDQQKALVTSAKMSALGEMAGGVAHEINTPLAVIQLRAEDMIDCVENDRIDSEYFNTGLNKIVQTVEKISKIIKGLRTFSRDSKKDPKSFVYISKIIEETLFLCREKFLNNGVDLEINYEKDFQIECRPVEISQVLLNLLNNAFDAVQSLEQKWVKLSIAEQDSMAVVKIQDSGRGISTELQEKIMEPFFTTKEVGKGTGLGLSISKGIIESHGGQIVIDQTSPNTQFNVTLPKKVAA